MARESGLVKRQKKLSGYDFFILMILGLTATSFPSLAALVSLVDEKVTRQALHKWYTEEAVIFLQNIFAYICSIRMKEVGASGYLQQFSSVLLCDSTWWELIRSSALEEVFKRFGGKYSESTQCKMQLVVNYLTGAIEKIAITEATKNDPTFHDDLLSMLKVQALLIVDLGYFSIKFFKLICQKGAYFISRLKSGTTIHHPKTFQRLNLLKIAKESGEDEFEFRGLLGKERLSCRIIGAKVPKSVADTRKAKYYDQCKRKKRSISKEHAEELEWSFFITNISEKKMPAAQVILTYSIRWQIELIFKMLKSILNLDFTMIRKNVNRIICEIYGKLILASFLTKAHHALNEVCWEESETEISLNKVFKKFKDRSFRIAELMLTNVQKGIKYCSKIFEQCTRTCIRVRQKTRMSPREKILKIPIKSFIRLTGDYLLSLS